MAETLYFPAHIQSELHSTLSRLYLSKKLFRILYVYWGTDDSWSNFFSRATFSKISASNRPRFFCLTRYGSKDEILYIGCYNRVVWDTENLSILDLVKSQMVGLGDNVLCHRTLSTSDQIHPDFFLVTDISWKIMFRTLFATIKRSGTPETSWS